MPITHNTPQAFTAAVAAAVAPNLPGWSVVSDIAPDRETRDKYIVLHAGEAQPVPGVPGYNCTMRLPVTVVAGWSPDAELDSDLATAQFVGAFSDFFAGIEGQPFPATDGDNPPGWVVIDSQVGFPVAGTDGVYYSVSVVFDLVVQF